MVLLWIAGGILLAILALYRWQRSLLYYPRAEPRLEPTIENCMTHHMLKTDDGEQIEVLWAQPPLAREGDTRATLIFFCGNAGNITHRIPNVENLLVMVGCNVLLVSYRGFGLSTGSPSEEGLKIDALAAIEWVMDPDRRQAVDPQKVFIFGRSLGGAVALSLATHPRWQDSIRGVIIENTFTSILDMVDVVFPILKPFKPLCKDTWLSLEKIRRLRTSLLVLSACHDELVPPRHCETLFEEANDTCFRRIIKFEEGGHMTLWASASYYMHLREFLSNPDPFISDRLKTD